MPSAGLRRCGSNVLKHNSDTGICPTQCSLEKVIERKFRDEDIQDTGRNGSYYLMACHAVNEK